ncbi:hypothetical protein QQX98_000099 [Neonectria punicea]|uniref:Uncharacterized protein n=1 Tax=Neonectria punicea TaxID=979145 RepID=A0ABR1HVH5_9HYPO
MFFSRIRSFVRKCYQGEFDSSGNPNPTLLAVAAHGYRVQSRALGIPDGWGFFCPGHARLQVLHASLLNVVVTCMAFVVPFQVLTGVLTFNNGFSVVHVLGGWAMMAAVDVGFIAAVWMLSLSDRRRAADYSWSDWKLRQD